MEEALVQRTEVAAVHHVARHEREELQDERRDEQHIWRRLFVFDHFCLRLSQSHNCWLSDKSRVFFVFHGVSGVYRMSVLEDI